MIDYSHVREDYSHASNSTKGGEVTQVCDGSTYMCTIYFVNRFKISVYVLCPMHPLKICAEANLLRKDYSHNN